MAEKTLSDRIAEAIHNLIKLKITTTVLVNDTSKSIVTEIDLLQGDITTTMGDEFVSGAYVSLRDFHQKREEQGQSIIKANVEALQSLLDLDRQTKPGAAAAPAGPPPAPRG